MSDLENLIGKTVEAYQNGNKLLIAGNGGSAAEADHLAAEMVGMYKEDNRRALPALSLSASSAIVTSLANDKGYDQVFARQVEAYGQAGDILLILTTSDASETHSANLLEALITAIDMGLTTAGLVSKHRTHDLLNYLQIAVLADGTETSEIQENQLRMIHELSGEVEKAFV